MIDPSATTPHKLLKQSPPFLFVDRVVEIKEREIVCLKQVAYNEPYLAGHFPGEPIVPGVLLVEMAAQAAALLDLASLPEAARAGRVAFLAQVEGFTFYRPARPGDSLSIRVRLGEATAGFQKADALITIAGSLPARKVAKGTLTFTVP